MAPSTLGPTLDALCIHRDGNEYRIGPPPHSQTVTRSSQTPRRAVPSVPPYPITYPSKPIRCPAAKIIKSLKHANDLLVFKTQDAPWPTVSFPADPPIEHILDFYGVPAAFVRPVYSGKSTRCRCATEVNEFCGTFASVHAKGSNAIDQDSTARGAPSKHDDIHVREGQHSCPWPGCERDFHATAAALATHEGLFMDFLRDHILACHLGCRKSCRLCKHALEYPVQDHLRPQGKGYTLEEHLASGYCTGLAKFAITKGLPVPRPH